MQSSVVSSSLQHLVRRYEGIDFVESSDCGCSGYGLFCCCVAPLESVTAPRVSTIDVLEHLFQCLLVFSDPVNVDFVATCPVCSLRVVNCFLNVLYHHQQPEGGGVAVPLAEMMTTSRPQQGYVFPLLVSTRNRVHNFDDEVGANFARGHNGNQVFATYSVYIHTKVHTFLTECVYTILLVCTHISLYIHIPGSSGAQRV